MMAGGLVLVAIIGTVVVTVLIAGGLEFVGKRTYTVRFPLNVGVAGLERGAEVTLGGRRVGNVKSVEFENGAPGEINDIVVVIAVNKDVQFREGVWAFLERPLLGSTSSINFIALGDGAPIADGPIPGRLSPPSFLAQAGYGDQEAANLRSMLQRGSDLMEKAEGAVDDFRSSIIADVRAITSDARVRYDTWAGRIDSITANLDEGVARGKEVVADIHLRVDQIQELLSTAQAYLDENRGDVRAFIQRGRSISEKGDQFMDRLGGEIADQLEGLLEDGRAAMADARGALERIDGVLAEQVPNVRKGMANFRLASDQLRDSMAEIRRSPWRLLYRPDTREIEYELLYDSARIYASAVSDLRAATESLQVIIETGGRAATRGETLEPMLDDLYRAFEKYGSAEQLFLDEIIRKAK